MTTKVLIICGILLFYINSNAQNFPGNDVQLLNGKELRVLPLAESSQKYGYKSFYKDENLKKIFEPSKSYTSEYNSLVNKIFKVISYNPYVNSIGSKKIQIKIKNEDIGFLYFDYDPKYEHSFPFEVIGGLDLPEDFYCKEITVSIDKFTNDTTYRSPNKSLTLVKIKSKQKIEIYFSTTTWASTLNVGKEGLIILLENGNKIEKPTAKIDTEVSKMRMGGYEYTVFIRLNNEDISKLLESVITDIRLYIYDKSIKDGEKYREYLKCLEEK